MLFTEQKRKERQKEMEGFNLEKRIEYIKEIKGDISFIEWSIMEKDYELLKWSLDNEEIRDVYKYIMWIEFWDLRDNLKEKKYIDKLNEIEKRIKCDFDEILKSKLRIYYRYVYCGNDLERRINDQIWDRRKYGEFYSYIEGAIVENDIELLVWALQNEDVSDNYNYTNTRFIDEEDWSRILKQIREILGDMYYEKLIRMKEIAEKQNKRSKWPFDECSTANQIRHVKYRHRGIPMPDRNSGWRCDCIKCMPLIEK